MITWDVSPTFFHLGEREIRYYGLLFSLGFFIAYKLFQKIYAWENKPVAEVDWLLNYMAVGTLVGARLMHCFAYQPSYYLANLSEIPQFWKGGLASHGAALGIVLATWIYSKRHKDQPFLWLIDRVSILTLIAGSCIRFGNLFNSEIVGIPSDLPWAFVFTLKDNIPRHPAQLYEAVTYLFLFFFLFNDYLKNYRNHKKADGTLFAKLLVYMFSARFIIEFFKEKEGDLLQGVSLNTGHILSIPIIISGVLLYFAFAKKRRN